LRDGGFDDCGSAAYLVGRVGQRLVASAQCRAHRDTLDGGEHDGTEVGPADAGRDRQVFSADSVRGVSGVRMIASL